MYNPYQPPQQPRRRLIDRYRSLSKNKQTGVGCLILTGCLIICALCGTSANAAGIFNTPTSTPTPTQVAQATTAHVTSVPVATPTKAPTPTPVLPTPVPPTPTPNPCPNAPYGNPWCYNLNGGSLIYNPPADFCAYFPCITNFDNGRGFVNECNDGDYSKSGGIRGDCSDHGGEKQPLYSN